MKSLIAVIKRELLLYFSSYFTPMFVAIYVTLQTVVFAYVLTDFVKPEFLGNLTYLQFYALGSPTIALSTTSYAIGRDIFRDKESGFSKYLSSLPLDRKVIVIGRGLSGAIRSTILILPLYLLAAVLLQSPLLSLLLGGFLLFILGMGLSGLGMAYVSLFNRENNWSTLVTILDVALVRSSSAMYPIVAMPGWLQLPRMLRPLEDSSTLRWRRLVRA